MWDFFGASNREVQIQKIEVFGLATTATVSTNFSVKKRSTANTGGTSVQPTKVAHNSAFTASSSTVKTYTVSPTLGTEVGEIFRQPVSIGMTMGKLFEIDYSKDTGRQPVTLNLTIE